MDRTYICIDLKSYYASVECVARGMDPLKANLLVADDSRTDKTIVLAVSPALKAIGVPGRPRLFEAKQKIRDYEAAHHTRIEYVTAPPRMAVYIRVSSKIYEIYRKYVCKDDIHVYSIDECFIDVTGYLHFYEKDAKAAGISPAHQMAITMIRDVLAETGITAMQSRRRLWRRSRASIRMTGIINAIKLIWMNGFTKCMTGLMTRNRA